MEILAAITVTAVFGAVIVCQVTGRGPEIWAIFGIGAIATVLSGVLSPGGAVSALYASVSVVAFLFALFVLTAALDRAGTIEHLALWVLGRARRPQELPFVLFVGIGLVSALVVNDALVLIGVPLLIAVAARLRADPKPLLLVLAFSVTVGSTLTPWGNPQNLLVAVASGVASPVTVFLRYLAIPTAINLLVGGAYLGWAYRGRLPGRGDPALWEGGRRRFFPRGGWRERLRKHPVVAVFPATMVALVAFGLGATWARGPSIPSWEIAVAGAGVVLALSPGRVQTLQRVHWPILLLFVGLFIVVAGAVSGGVISAVGHLFPIPGPGNPSGAVLAVVATSTGGSQIVSNVPWVALQIPVLSALGYGAGTPVIWMALAAGSTLAGNVTILGAASNLIVVGAAKQQGIRISLADFMRQGIPIAAITIAILLACLLVGV